MEQSTCCFTGHRPAKLSYGFDEHNPDCLRLKRILKKEIELKIKSGCTRFITGMAMGADIWCAEFVIAFKQKYPQKAIELVAAIPYKNQTNTWPADYLKRYSNILKKADQTAILSDQYKWGCMQVRNRYMVDLSNCMIGVFNGSAGGTKSTISYAIKKGIDIVILNPDSGMREHIGRQLHF